MTDKAGRLKKGEAMKIEEAIEILKDLYKIRCEAVGYIPPYKKSKEADAFDFAIGVLEKVNEEKIRDLLDTWGYRNGNMLKCTDSDFLKIAAAIVEGLDEWIR